MYKFLRVVNSELNRDKRRLKNIHINQEDLICDHKENKNLYMFYLGTITQIMNKNFKITI